MSQKMSLACGTSLHERCDGTALPMGAREDEPFMRSLRETHPDEDWTCACICHLQT